MARKKSSPNNQSSQPCFRTELFVFLSQVFVFFLVAVFTSDFLKNEQHLAEHIKIKVNNNTFEELGLTLLAITVALGTIFIIKQIIQLEIVDRVASEILIELPRTIYIFGSSITGLMLAVAWFYLINQSTQPNMARTFILISVVFSIIAFLYGYGLKVALARKDNKKTRG